MADDELQQRWSRTRDHLEQAHDAMPLGDDHDLAWYSDFLDNMELELAMDALAEVAARRGASLEVWTELTAAAREMGLVRAFPL